MSAPPPAGPSPAAAARRTAIHFYVGPRAALIACLREELVGLETLEVDEDPLVDEEVES